MLVPVKWLKEYVKIEADIPSFCEKMIMSGSNIETAKKLVGDYQKIIVGKIVKKEKHPEADKLFVTQIDTGSEVVQIITGADNIFEGAYIPVILDGGVLPTGVKIKKGKLRGLDSNGMLCSPEELGFADKVIPVSQRDGIMILEGAYTPGQDIAEALDIADETVIEFEITPNRPDCLSVIGLAREAAAVFDEKITYPDTSCRAEAGDVNDYIAVEIKRPDLCKRYTGRVITDVKIGPSPWWMQEKLMAAGMRPINNIVDITNYVLLEYGQPIHAFDLRQIEGKKIVVDTAAAGQKFTTLDGTERTLDQETLLICDGKKAVAIAGIMGGLNSEIESDTRQILIESANFVANSVRSTSKKIGLRTEASSRYEKGLDPGLCLEAANRVCRLVEILGAGTVTSGIVDVYPAVKEAWTVSVRTSYVNAQLGISLSPQELAHLFEKLEIKTQIDGDVVMVRPPTVRIDLIKEIDFVEEAARVYGYDNLPSTLPKMDVRGGKCREHQMEDLVKQTFLAQGYNEIQTYSFTDPAGIGHIKAKSEFHRNFVKIMNPLGEENSVMRTTLVPGMLEVLARNVSRSVTSARVFEIGKIFTDAETNQTGEPLPAETKYLLAGAYGPEENFYTLKGTIEEILDKMGIRALCFKACTDNETFHPGRCANVFFEGKEIGVIGELHPDVVEQYDLKERLYLAEFNFDELIKIANIEKVYKPIPRYPAVDRDIAVIVKEDVSVGELQDIIKKQGKKLLEEVRLFDIYRGKQIKEGCKSIAFSLRYRDPEKTLKEEDVTRVHKKVLQALKDEMDADLRDM